MSATIGQVTETITISSYLPVISFEISESEIWIVAKGQCRLAICDITPVEAASAPILWRSSDPNNTSIDGSGLISTTMPGEAIISADSENGIHRECLVHICYPVTDIEFEQNEAIVFPGFDYKVKANVTMRTQSCVNHLVAFSSSNPEIATIDESGVVHGIKAGTTTITAIADSGVTASMTVTVRDALVLKLPSGLIEIEDEAFSGSACEVVIIPEGCTTIGEKAFANCKKLIRVIVPASVKNYPVNAFEGCNEDLVIDWEDH